MSISCSSGYLRNPQTFRKQNYIVTWKEGNSVNAEPKAQRANTQAAARRAPFEIFSGLLASTTTRCSFIGDVCRSRAAQDFGWAGPNITRLA